METNKHLEIIDEIIEEKTQEEGFVIDSDEKAEWALKKIAEERYEFERYENVCKAMISEYEEKIRQAKEKLSSKTAYFEGQLQAYFQTVSLKKTKTQETYKLPTGTLKLKYRSPEFKRDEEKLLNWLKENEMQDFIKTEEKANWGEFKKEILISNNAALSKDGVIVEGIEVIEREPVFEIET